MVECRSEGSVYRDRRTTRRFRYARRTAGLLNQRCRSETAHGAAVDADDGTRHERRSPAAEEGDDVGELLGATDATHRDRGLVLGTDGARVAAVDPGERRLEAVEGGRVELSRDDDVDRGAGRELQRQ